MDGFEAEPESGGPSAADAESDDALRDLVVDMSTNLMGAAPDEFDTKLEWEVRRITERLGADRGYVFVDASDGFDLVAEHAGDASERVDASRPPGAREWPLERLRRFESVVVPDVDDLPDGAGAFRDHLRSDGVRSVLLLPIISDWTFTGVLGFDVVRRREWDEGNVDLLRSVAELIGHSRARVRRERELRRQNERLDAFASTISHDLRNPLAAAAGAIEVARSRDDPTHLDRAADAIERMDRLVDRVLTLARAGQGIGDTRRVALDYVIDRAWETVGSDDLSLDRDDDLGAVEADDDRLQEALENLFRNCVEHAPSASTVRVGRLAEGTGIYVADDGPGLADVDGDALFDQGYSTDDGTGLGLAIVRDVVEAHGWTVGARDAADGGARFEIDGMAFVD